MNQLQPNTGTHKDKEQFPFMSEQGVRGQANYQVTYYTANQAIAHLLAEVNKLQAENIKANQRIDEMEKMFAFM